MADFVSVAGLADLKANFALLADEMQKRAAFSSVLAGSNVVKKQAIRNVESRGLVLTGALKRNIAVKRKRTPLGLAMYQVIVRHGRDAKTRKKTQKLVKGKVRVQYKDDPYYWKFLEFGTSKMVARPFLVPAFEATKEKQLDAMRLRLRARIEKYLKK